jgi:hypothetical protein
VSELNPSVVKSRSALCCERSIVSILPCNAQILRCIAYRARSKEACSNTRKERTINKASQRDDKPVQALNLPVDNEIAQSNRVGRGLYDAISQHPIQQH